MDKPLGFCTVCIRVRYLAQVTGVDRLNNPAGVCTGCAQPVINPSNCPHSIMVPEHYREDGSCKCDDPNDPLMAEWGYYWSEDYEEWQT